MRIPKVVIRRDRNKNETRTCDKIKGLLVLLLALGLAVSAQSVQGATATWTLDASTTSSATNATGYNLHIGTASGVYTQTINVGNVSSYTVTTLSNGTRYYAVVKAYNSAGLEGPASNEATFVPMTPIAVTNGTTMTVSTGTAMPINVTTAGQFNLIGSVNAPNTGENSLWIDFDRDPASDDTRAWDLVVGTAFGNQTATWRGANAKTSNDPSTAQFNPKAWALTAGAHTLYIDAREVGTQIQSVQFVTAPAPLAPMGFHSLTLAP